MSDVNTSPGLLQEPRQAASSLLRRLVILPFPLSAGRGRRLRTCAMLAFHPQLKSTAKPFLFLYLLSAHRIPSWSVGLNKDISIFLYFYLSLTQSDDRRLNFEKS